MSDFNFGQKPAPGVGGEKPSPFGYESPPPPSSSSDERTWAMLCHLSGFVCYIIGPLVVWLIKREESAFVDDQGKEALNFQISVTLYSLVCVPLMLVIIGVFLLIALAIFNIVVTIIAAVRASQGEYYRYPLSIRFVS